MPGLTPEVRSKLSNIGLILQGRGDVVAAQQEEEIRRQHESAIAQLEAKRKARQIIFDNIDKLDPQTATSEFERLNREISALGGEQLPAPKATDFSQRIGDILGRFNVSDVTPEDFENSASGLKEARQFAISSRNIETERIDTGGEILITEKGNPDNVIKRIPKTAAPQSGGEKFSELQGKTAGFAVRMQQSEDILASLDLTEFTGVEDRLAGITPQGLKSDNRQKLEQAQRNFINAQLRRESGAAIAPSEFESAELQYFPQPGDSEAVLAQKAENRLAAIQAMKTEAGPAFDKLSKDTFGSAETVLVQGKRVAIGSPVTNSRGETGIVMADGTIQVGGT